MLNFRKPELSDRDWFISCVKAGSTEGTSYSFGSMFAWREAYRIEIAEYNGMLLMRGSDKNGRYYVYPSGKGDEKSAVTAMMEQARSDGEIFRLYQLLGDNKKALGELFPGMFIFSYDRDSSEYVYSVKNMAELSGKRFHGKKNHVNAFFKNHKDISCDPITDDNIHLCYEIENRWLAEHEDEYGELENEHIAIERALSNYKALGFRGALLYADGEAVAFTMGEPIKNNTFCTHYEKAVPEYKDAYPVINNGFTKLMLSNFDYVNREEDTGSEGLRKAKLSYHPEFLLDKYSAVLKNDPMRKYSVSEDDIPALKSLWKTVFGDDDDTVNFFFDNCADFSNIYAYKVDGKVVSAFHLIDADIVTGRENYKSKYLYAAATLPEYRGNGYMGKMIEYAKYILSVEGYEYLFLYPSEDSLYNYYERFGFVSAFKARYYNIEKDELDSYKGRRYFNSSVSYGDMLEFTPAESYVIFPDAYLDFAQFCAKRYGFMHCDVFDDEVKTFIIGSSGENSDTLYVEEALASCGGVKQILSVLADTEYEHIGIKFPVDVDISDLRSEIRNAGMIVSLNGKSVEKTFYLGQPCM